MAEVQEEFTPEEEEARTKWKNLLLGSAEAIDETAPAEEEQVAEAKVQAPVVTPEVVENSPESVLSQLYKSMLKA
jgi:hypothetical protein